MIVFLLIVVFTIGGALMFFAMLEEHRKSKEAATIDDKVIAKEMFGDQLYAEIEFLVSQGASWQEAASAVLCRASRGHERKTSHVARSNREPESIGPL